MQTTVRRQREVRKEEEAWAAQKEKRREGRRRGEKIWAKMSKMAKK